MLDGLQMSSVLKVGLKTRTYLQNCYISLRGTAGDRKTAFMLFNALQVAFMGCTGIFETESAKYLNSVKPTK